MIFDNCGLDDAEFAAIIGGLSKLKDFKRIVYRRNVFSEQSLEALVPLLKRRQLEELRLESCEINDKITDELLDVLEETSALSRLSLRDMIFNKHCFD